MRALTGFSPVAAALGLNRWQRLGLAAFSGVLMTAGQPPVGIPWLMFLAVPILVWLLHGAPSARSAAWTGWAAGFGYFVTGLHWIGNAFLVDPDKFLLMMPLGVMGLPAGLALFWALAFWAAKRCWARVGWHGALVIATMLSAVELARGYVLTGFPWALPAYAWVDTPIMQAASWAGPFGLTFITLVLTGVPLVALAERRFVPVALSLAAFTALWIAGTARVPPEVVTSPTQPLIRLVQPNAPQHLKWEPGYREEFYKRALDATSAPPKTGDQTPDLVIWPEMAVFFVPAENPAEVERIAKAAGGAPVILGAFHREQQADGEFLSNAFHTILPDGTLGPRYDKHHLVPFGEYMPLVGVLGKLGLPDFSQGAGFSRGTGPQTLELPGLPSFSPIICYEAIFPYEAVGPERPAWIAQITNDAWFGSFAGPQQHLAQARFRAVEQGLPVVRATNTGISAMIDSYGRLVASIEMHNYDRLDARLPDALPSTLYSIVGDISFTILLVAMVFFTFLRRHVFRFD
ncbi:MAG: apolipoprotein N-acyltransferase [Pseudomonadota bacterium]